MNWNKNPPPPGVNPQYSSFHYNVGRFETEPPRQEHDDYLHKPGRPGGGWDAEEEIPVIKPKSDQYARPQSTFNPQPVYSTHPEPEHQEFHPREIRTEHKPAMAVREEAGEYEKILVEDITIPGGVRPRPSDKDMHEFVTKCKYLSPDIIMGLLMHLLGNSQRAFKALCVIEKLVFEYENFAEIAFDGLEKIRNAANNQAGQKICANILSRFNVKTESRPVETNIIDLF